MSYSFANTLDTLKKEQTRITVSLINGSAISGIIDDYDDTTIVVIEDNYRKVIFKQYITTISINQI